MNHIIQYASWEVLTWFRQVHKPMAQEELKIHHKGLSQSFDDGRMQDLLNIHEYYKKILLF
jgi:hypothetical protein